MPSLRTRHRLRTAMWIVPLLCLLAAVGLSVVTVAVDRAFDGHLIPPAITGPADAAATVLQTIATAMITLITLVLTVTTVAVQLAMAQFSPRIVRALFQDRMSQLSFGLFAATFAYALLALRAVDTDRNTVPGLTVLVAYLLMLSSVVVLFLYVHHAGNGLRAASLIDLVGDTLREQIDHRYPDDGALEIPRNVLVSREPGLVVDLDRPALVEAARAADCVLELIPMIGDFVPVGAPLFRVRGDLRRLDQGRVARLVIVGAERTHENDPVYGFRKLVDIAERGLEQPFTDPTTAIMVIDRLHESLRRLATRPFPSGRQRDAEGVVRLVERCLNWDGFVSLAFDELRLAGATSPQVPRRLRAALLDLKSVAPRHRHPPLDRQLALLDAAVARAYADEEDRRFALIPDQQGIGACAPFDEPGDNDPHSLPVGTQGVPDRRIVSR